MTNFINKKSLSVAAYAITGISAIFGCIAIGSTFSHQPVKGSDTAPLVAVLSLAVIGGTSLVNAAAAAVDD